MARIDTADVGHSGMTAQPSAGMTIVITVPLAPPKELLPNRRRNGSSHWRTQAEFTSQLRLAARGAALNARHLSRAGIGAGLLFRVPVIVSYDVVWPYERYGDKKPIPDHDSIPTAAKAALDGIVDAGIIGGDSEEFVVEVRAKGRRGGCGEDDVTAVTIIAAER